MQIKIPTRDEFVRGSLEFQKHEPRGAMYKIATFVLDQFWGQPADMADGLGVLLLTWNQAFYRYGPFSYETLERCIATNLPVLNSYRQKSILSLDKSDEPNIRHLFDAFLDALKIESGKSDGRSSPVAVAKALHLLGPSFFPLWDKAIADAYDCNYSATPASSYISFCHIMAGMAHKVQEYGGDETSTLLKRVDEYNYARFTKAWV